ncbi:hypothetical protein ASPSYDRAFT_40229 [Aspergillus sydowii CBS 593.65]|uniref:Uncharacterized protein n=1 Tax=Aspergillus sydowii CBS 593.65 TaxID=1036612 RepID=A0A1L9TQM6_9EURO|nr:uncharacterized protein ASPSYDRAFT_40229 [Aspergillus sydowii CBS 593.65]OJJ61685.1 hypothetical protein ASPSYDRAFT_40229 [Aspergillus sydowii CBS 593.65]
MARCLLTTTASPLPHSLVWTATTHGHCKLGTKARCISTGKVRQPITAHLDNRVVQRATCPEDANIYLPYHPAAIHKRNIKFTNASKLGSFFRTWPC